MALSGLVVDFSCQCSRFPYVLSPGLKIVTLGAGFERVDLGGRRIIKK
jgi:hypothetical protein